MIRRYPLLVFFIVISGCSDADLPPRYHDLHRVFNETEPHLLAIEQEMEKDSLWQLAPQYVDGAFNEPHVPELTSDQIAKYRDLLDLVPYVSYIDKANDRADFSLGSVTTDQWIFSFQFIHTARPARPENCDDVSMAGPSNVCSSDLGDDWALWVNWIEPSDAVAE